jgi:peptide/nickel transport system permease protein
MESNVDISVKEINEKVLSPGRIFWNKLKKNRTSKIGLFILIFMILFTVVGPYLSPYKIDSMDYTSSYFGPCLQHIFGTDNLGRDILTRMMYGGRVSLSVGIFSVVVEVIVGGSIGIIAGFYGGVVDSILMRVVDIFLCIPMLPILITGGVIMSDLKVSPGLRPIYLMFMIGLLSWAGLCRLVRGQVLSIRGLEYMQATEALGLSDWRKMFKHLLPNVSYAIIVQSALDVGGAIITESVLSFLGLGVVPPTPSWGQMIDVVSDMYNMQHYPWLWVIPGAFILLTVLSINLFGDGLREALDPKLMK